MNDPLTRLADLRSAESTPARAARRRMRCRAQLARQARQVPLHGAPPGRVGGAPLWQTALASLCVAYVAEAIVLAARVLRARW